MRRSPVLWIVAVVTSLAMISCSPAGEKKAVISSSPSNPQGQPAQSAAVTGSRVGDLAPAFILTRVDGGTVTLNGLVEEGKPFVLYFFATW